MPEWLHAVVDSVGKARHCFATDAAKAVTLTILLDAKGTAPPPIDSSPQHQTTAIPLEDGVVAYRIEVPAGGDHVVIDVSGPEVPPCTIELRRSNCRIETGLIGPLDPQTRSALLWLAWRRYSELVGLKSFQSPPESRASRYRGGYSGNDVLLFRPRLLAPTLSAEISASSANPLLVEGAWGGWLLVKSGSAAKTSREFERYRSLVHDRLSPFIARTEALLQVLPADFDAKAHSERRGTLISTFIGGDIVRADQLQHRVLSAPHFEACRPILDKTFLVLENWHRNGSSESLAEWNWVFHPRTPGSREPWLLFNRFDFARKARAHPDQPEVGAKNVGGREDFVRGIRWDVDFMSEAHLKDYVFGADGLLARLRDIRAHFGLVHGDLNPRNVLCDDHHAWLIDFEHVRVAPVLFDFARLEANLRVWCLTLDAQSPHFDDSATALEIHLLDHMHGSEGGLQPVRECAANLGVADAELVKIAQCVMHVRSLAQRFFVRDYADQRDYLAVLYLTVLSLLQYAHRQLAPVQNYRLLLNLAWVLESRLGRIVGLGAFRRTRVPFEAKQFVRADWLEAPGATRRVDYFMGTKDGPQALALLAATRGIAQPPSHHLDVYDHTLMVLEFVERILEHPQKSFEDPADLEERVTKSLSANGLSRLLVPRSDSPPRNPVVPGWTDAHREGILRLLTKALDETAVLRLKWSALLHDIGKPPTRAVYRKRRKHEDEAPVDEAGEERHIQFLGHELYAPQIADSLLKHLFSAEDEKGRFARLIEDHHHANQIVDRYRTEKSFRENLLASVAAAPSGAFDPIEAEFLEKRIRQAGSESELVLRLVHGLADRMARRGVRNNTTIQFETEVFLAVLAYLAFAGSVRTRSQELRDERPREKILDKELWRRYGSRSTNELRRKAVRPLLRMWKENGEALAALINKELDRLDDGASP